MTVTRLDIVGAADDGLARVLAIADAFPATPLGPAYLDRTTTDVLGHLHGWHLLFAGWLGEAATGEDVHYPAEGFTWRDLDALNERLYEDHREMPYQAMRAALVDSHARVLGLIGELSDHELTDPQVHPWLGKEPLGEVAHEVLGGHYDWAMDIFAAAHLSLER